MRNSFSIGVILLILGIVGLAYESISFTTKEKVIDVGPIQVSKDKERSFPIQPFAGAIAVAGGVLMLLSSRRD